MKVSALLGGLLLILLVSCDSSKPHENPLILASIRPLSLMVSDLLQGVDDVTVETLLPANADPHNFSLRVSDRTALERAQWIIWLGPQMEAFLSKVVATRAPDEHLQLLSLPELARDEPHQHAHGDHGGVADDPHVWLDPAKAQRFLPEVAARLKRVVPRAVPQIDANLARLQESLHRFTDETQSVFEPIVDRPFAVHHNALGHFVDAFGLNQVAAINTVPEQMLSAQRMEQLRQQLGDAACLLAEQDTAQVRRLATLLELPVVQVDPLATSPEVSTYIEVLESVRASVLRCLS